MLLGQILKLYSGFIIGEGARNLGSHGIRFLASKAMPAPQTNSPCEFNVELVVITTNSLGQQYRSNILPIFSIIFSNLVYKSLERQNMKAKYTLNENFFDEIDTEEKAYFLGFLYADGYNQEKGHKIIINLQARDKNILDKFKVLIESTKPIYFIPLKKKHPTWQDEYSLHLINRRISARLKELGCYQGKSMNLKWPPQGAIPPDLMKHFIRGYFDGDGCLRVRQPKNSKFYLVSFVANDEFMKAFVKYIKQELKIKFAVHPHKKIYQAELYSRGDCLLFLNYIYQDNKISLDRKYNLYLEFLDYIQKNPIKKNQFG